MIKEMMVMAHNPAGGYDTFSQNAKVVIEQEEDIDFFLHSIYPGYKIRHEVVTDYWYASREEFGNDFKIHFYKGVIDD